MFLVPKVRVVALLASGVLAAGALAAPVAANSGAGRHGLTGIVKCSTSPIGAAGVYAYQVADFSLTRVTTDSDGRFLFRALPVGIYKIIAHKTGFVPAVVLFSRAAEAANDYLEFELVEEATITAEDADFWSVRRKIPGDVLRSIQLAEAAEAEGQTPRESSPLTFETELVTGYDQRSERASMRRADGAVGISGRLSDRADINIRAQFQEVTPEASFSTATKVPSGDSLALFVSVDDRQARRSISVSTIQHDVDRGFNRRGNRIAPVAFEHYQFAWSEQLSPNSHTEVRLSQTDELNFNGQTNSAPETVPRSSSMWQIDGRHSQEVTESFSYRTGVSYRQLYNPFAVLGNAVGMPQQRVDAFGVATSRPRPGLLVEYGLYSSMRDGRLSLSPHGGIVVRFGNDWQADASIREQIRTPEGRSSDFSWAHYTSRNYDGSAEGHLYKIGLKHQPAEGRSIRLGVSHREIRDTIRVFFSDDFFDQMVQSIYLVDGDQLPEFEVALSRRLGRQILATIAGNYGDGGGGLYIDGRGRSFENRVRYLVTRLDTQFLRTATGIMLAFHQIEQDLDPLRGYSRQTEAAIDRLQLRLTQDLGFLRDLGADWALLIDVELRRGLSAFERASVGSRDPTELRSQVAGGIAVKF